MAPVFPAFNRRVALDTSSAPPHRAISGIGRLLGEAGNPPEAVFARSSGLTASIPVLFQQHVEKSLPVAEIRALKPVKRIHQVNQAAFRG
jgi:hypothetical protein